VPYPTPKALSRRSAVEPEPDGAERMLTGLDMASGRQPKAGQPVVAQQHAPGRPVDEQQVRHQMR